MYLFIQNILRERRHAILQTVKIEVVEQNGDSSLLRNHRIVKLQ
jgi:hypothetical protein